MERKHTMEATEQQRATIDEMAKVLNSGLFSRIGVPASSWKPPGTLVEEEKATVAISAATTELHSEVLFCHSPAALTRSL